MSPSTSIGIEDSAKYYFRISEIGELSNFSRYLDTIEGECDDVATIVYKNWTLHFVIDDIIQISKRNFYGNHIYPYCIFLWILKVLIALILETEKSQLVVVTFYLLNKHFYVLYFT